MADISKTIEIIFEGIDRVGDTVSSVGSQMSGLSGQVTAVAGPFAAFGEGVLKADAALAAMVVGGMALAISKTGEFNTAFAEISTIMGGSAEDVNKFKTDIENYASGSTQSIENINKSVYNAISAGVSYKDSLDLIGVSEKLSVAGKADLDSTTMLLVGTMNAYGASTSEAGRFSDVFFQTVKAGQTTVPELAASLSNVSGIAASAGVPIETLGASIAALTVSGIPTSQAMTGLKAALSNIISPSSEAATAAAAMGIQFNASALQSKGLEGVLKDVQTATGGNIEKMAGLFGSTEALNSVMILAADKSGIFAKTLGDMKNASGTTAEAFEKMKDNLGLSMQTMVNNLDLVLIKTGAPLIATFSGNVSGVSDIFKSIGTAIDAGTFKPLFDALNETGGKVTEWMKGVADALPAALAGVDFAPIIEAVKSLGEGMGEMWGDLDLTKPEDLGKVIQFVIDTIGSLITITAGMVDAFKPMIQGVIDSVSAFNSMESSTKESSGGIAAVAMAVVNGGIMIAGAVISIIGAGESLKGVFEIIIESIGLMWNSAQATIDSILVVITGSMLTLVNAADTLSFGAFGDELEGVRTKLTNWNTTYTEALTKNIQEGVDNVAGVAKGFRDLGGSADEVTVKVKDTGIAIEEVPDTKEIKVEHTFEEVLAQIQSTTTGLKEIPENKQITIGATADTASIQKAQDAISIIKDEKGVLVITAPDNPSIQKTKEVIAKEIPAEKKLEIQTELQIATIKAQTDIITGYFDFKAKVDVAEIEAAAEVTKAAFESIGKTLEATTETLGGLFGLWEGADVHDKGNIEMWMKQQFDLQERAVVMQEQLTGVQVAYYEAKVRSLNRGDALVTIQGDGLAPQLEAFMFAVLDAVQVRVAEEHADFLIGIA